MTTRWDAARYRQQQTPRKYKPCGPVGPTPVQLEGMKWDRAIAVTRARMAERPDFDAVICCPQDAERLKVLGLRLIPYAYARKGEWSLYATPKEPTRLTEFGKAFASCPEPEMPPCPPCPECGHLHRLGGCVDCQCSLWEKPGALRRYNELLAQQHYRVLEKRHEAERERRGS